MNIPSVYTDTHNQISLISYIKYLLRVPVMKRDKELDMNISQVKFEAFEDVRKSGQTNMWDTTAIVNLAEMLADTELSHEEVSYIRSHYDELFKKYEFQR